MRTLTFGGTYYDESRHDPERITWQIVESTSAQPPGWGPGYEIHTSIRGIAVTGRDFDLLDPDSVSEAEKVGLTLGPLGLTSCVLSGALPCTIEAEGNQIESTIGFVLDLRGTARSGKLRPPNLTLSVSTEIADAEVVDDWFEDGMLSLESALPPGVRLRCCVTCLYSDYSPGGHGLTGMFCHREAKEQYLAVESKGDYWSVPVTEEVIETYICDDYARRRPGTGYRG